MRGAWILSAYAVVLGVWFLAGVAGADGLVRAMAWIGAPLAVATAGYTAFLFGQAEARDLWQSPMLLWHMVAGAFAAGGGIGSVVAFVVDVDPTYRRAALWSMVGGAAALGLIALVELTSHHPTRNIEMAMHHMTRGVFSRQWWLGGQLVGVIVPVVFGAGTLNGSPQWVAALGGLAAAAGIYFADDAFVKAGQSVPLS